MKLYDRVERVWNEVGALGLPPDATLDVRELAAFDHLHYHGTDAVDALELQEDIHETAAALTARTGLGERVRHLRGNILDGPPVAAAYDAAISYLCILHIPDRAALFPAIRAALRPGGALYIEDFTLRREPTAHEAEALRDRVQCSYLPPLATYVEQLEAAGFEQVEADDMTDSWRAFTAERLDAFRAARPRHLAVHGPAIVDGLDEFYGTVAGLYGSGVLGGARIVARA